MRKLICALCLMLSSNAWSLDTADLIESCESNEGQGDLYCVGYYSGAVQATAHVISLFRDDGAFKLYCAPENFSMGIGIKIWKRYVEANPEMLTDPAFYTITLSLQDAYPPPCE